MTDQKSEVELIQNLARHDRWVAWLRLGGVGVWNTLLAIGGAVADTIGGAIRSAVGVSFRGRSNTTFFPLQRWGN